MSQNKLGAGGEVAAEALYDAVAALSDADFVRLRGFAAWKVRGLGVAGFGLDPEDVIQEAVLRTLDGDRTWRKNAVGLLDHLMGVISSLTSHWAEKVARRAPTVTAADLPRPDDSDDEDDPLEALGNGLATPEREVAAKEMLEQVEGLFGDDEMVSLVMLGMREEMKGPEIQKDLGISENEYEAIVKRMRTKVRTTFPKGGRYARA